MNRLVWKLLRQHQYRPVDPLFPAANLFGMLIVLLSVQFYRDVLPRFHAGRQLHEKELYHRHKENQRGSAGFTGRSNTFSPKEIEEMKEQSFTESVGAFHPFLV